MTDAPLGLVLHSPEGTSYVFDPGALCLELLPTGGPGALARHEVLHEPGDLAAWFGRSRLRLDPAGLRVGEADLRAARELRAALWGMARAAAHGDRPDDRDVAAVNRAAAQEPLAPEITAAGAHGWRHPACGGQALASVARDGVELFTGRFAGRVRECGAHDCFLIFADTSRPGRRRWCAMERCGNRNKVRALRARRDTEETP